MRLYGVRKLSELDGQFFVHARCVKCGRRSCFWAKDLQARLPMRLRLNADLDAVKELFTCKECKARKPTVWAMSTPMDDDDSEYDFLIDFTGLGQ
jgi:hypothetical protein